MDSTFVSFNHLTHKYFQAMLELITLALLQFASFSFDATGTSSSAATDSGSSTTCAVDHGVGGWGDGHIVSDHGVGGWGDGH
ncbi:hypothetical protein [Hymenobacter sp. UYP22]|uniref:hypothetical protein n=1 Tax=Hymenobacter sp. UYP22 TaxID=3156348 RepID=UPI0033949143